MALPVTITGISTAVAPVGPFKSSGGNYYFFGRDGTTATTLQAYKASDPTSNINTLANPITHVVLGASAFNTKLSQSFTTSNAFSLSTITVALSKIGSAHADNLLADLFLADGSGYPTGSSLGQASLAPASITGTATDFNLTFSPISLSAGTKYCIVLSRSGAVDNVSYFRWSGSASAYTDGNAGVWNGTAWATVAVSDFRLIVTEPTGWRSITTKTGFATGIQNISAYQVADVVHMCITDGATTSINHKYQTFNMASDTFVTAETINSALNTTTSASANAYGTAIVVRSTSEVVVHYQAARISTFAQTAYRRRTGVATWAAGVAVSTTGVNAINPFVALGTSDRLHFLWFNSTNTIQRHLTSANVLGTAASTGATATAQDVITIASGTPNFIGLTAASAFRWASADNPTVTNAAVTLGTPVRGADASSVSYVLYQSSTDSDLYIKTSSDNGATWGTAISEFVGTVVSADANLSKNQLIYTRGSATVFPYVVNDNGTLKYDEYLISAGVTHYTMPVTVGTLTADGEDVTLRYARALTMPVTVGTLTAAGQDVTLTEAAGATHYTMPVDTGTVTLAGQAVTLRAVRKLVAGQGTLTLAGQLTTLARSRMMPVTTGTLTPAGQTVVPRVTMPVTLGTLALGGQTVVLRTIRKLAAGQSTLTLAGQSAILTEKNSYGLIASHGILALAGQAVTVRYARTPMAAGQGALTLAGQPVTLRYTRVPMLAGLGTLTLSGQIATTRYGHKTAGGFGTITLAGQTAALKRSYVMPVGLGTLTLAEPVINLIFSGAGSKTLPAGIGFQRLDGQAATLRYAHKLIAGTGALALAGQAVTLRRSRLPLVAGQGTLTLAGQTATLRYAHRMPAGLGTLTPSGQNVTLKRSRVLPAGLGTITLLEPVVNLIYSNAGVFRLPAGLGFPRLDGQPVTLRYGRMLPAARGTLTLSGQVTARQYGRRATITTGNIVLGGRDVDLTQVAREHYTMTAAHGVLALEGMDVSMLRTRAPPVMRQETLRFGRSVYVSRW